MYYGSGNYIIGLEKYPEVMRAMQSLLISSHQVLRKMVLTNKIEFYNSEYVRAILSIFKKGGVVTVMPK